MYISALINGALNMACLTMMTSKLYCFFCFGEAFEVPLMQTQIERMPELLIDMHNLVNKKSSRFDKRCASLLSLSSFESAKLWFS